MIIELKQIMNVLMQLKIYDNNILESYYVRQISTTSKPIGCFYNSRQNKIFSIVKI